MKGEKEVALSIMNNMTLDNTIGEVLKHYSLYIICQWLTKQTTKLKKNSLKKK